MSLPVEKPVIKAVTISTACKQHGWHGTIHSDIDDATGIRYTVVAASRNDERLKLQYQDNTMVKGDYYIFDKHLNLSCASAALEKIQGWPDLLKLFKWFPQKNKPTLVKTYRMLPFSFDEPNEDIIAKLVGKQLVWYSQEAQKYHGDVVTVPRSSTSKNFRITDVGHRKLFHFIGAQAGFRSVLLDTVLKVS